MNLQVYEELHVLRENSKFCDAMLVGEDRVCVPVHSCVLAAASSTLQEAMEGLVATKNNQIVIQVPFLNKAGIENMLHFIYLGRFIEDKVNVADLKLVAEKLQIKCLMDVFLKLQHTCGDDTETSFTLQTFDTKKEVKMEENAYAEESFSREETIEKPTDDMLFEPATQPEEDEDDEGEFPPDTGAEEEQMTAEETAEIPVTITSMEENSQDSNMEKTEEPKVAQVEEEVKAETTSQDLDKSMEDQESANLEMSELSVEQNLTISEVSDFGLNETQNISVASQVLAGWSYSPKKQAVSLLKNSPALQNLSASNLENVFVTEPSPLKAQSLLKNTVFQMEEADVGSSVEIEDIERDIVTTAHQLEENSATTSNEQAPGGEDEIAAHVHVEALVTQPSGQSVQLDVWVPPLALQEDGVNLNVLQDIIQKSGVLGTVDADKLAIMYKCRQCEQAYTDLTSYSHHMMLHDATRQHFCPICGSSFKYKHNMKLHLRRHGHKGVTCRFCQKPFFSKHDLDLHMRMHTGEKPFKCEFCDKTFSQSSNMLSHKRSVHNDVFLHGRKEHVCSYCQKAFKTRDMRQKHEKRHLAKHTCLKCDSFFRTRTEFQRHMKNAHDVSDICPSREDGDLEVFQCMICLQNFLSRKKLDMHTQLVHQKTRRYKCPFDYCDYEAYYKCHIDRHVKTHQTRKKFNAMNGTPLDMFQCRLCKAEFTTRKILASHRCKGIEEMGNDDTIMEFQVESLDTTNDSVDIVIKSEKGSSTSPMDDFSLDSSLAGHEKVLATQLADGRVEYTCKLCNTSVFTPKGIEKHLATHDPNREVYSCDLCDRGFFQKAHLHRHMLLNHKKEKRFQCVEASCLFCCYYMSQMNQHYILKHPQTPCPAEHRLRILDITSC